MVWHHTKPNHTGPYHTMIFSGLSFPWSSSPDWRWGLKSRLGRVFGSRTPVRNQSAVFSSVQHSACNAFHICSSYYRTQFNIFICILNTTVQCFSKIEHSEIFPFDNLRCSLPHTTPSHIFKTQYLYLCDVLRWVLKSIKGFDWAASPINVGLHSYLYPYIYIYGLYLYLYLYRVFFYTGPPLKS